MCYQSMQFFIHSYSGAVLGFLSVIGLTKKLYKISHTLSVFFSKMLAISHIHQLMNFIMSSNQEFLVFLVQNVI
ncbi:hypothetical protein COJ87_18380 [Bacillus cereus]|nr:hypothetical protein COM76_00625 [Bacillus cereus]PGA53528.1 hypothetical protein COL88_10360 [Bacillus thuringiensis]QEL78030.1 hypothetical protein DN407_05170 [Bacillus sp. JAS24-2]PED37225.1 hypothetical protein CON24_15945 [Bacillus cereus]PEG01090.1 hypothetical protein CON54_31105 [Bacillus cereus]